MNNAYFSSFSRRDFGDKMCTKRHISVIYGAHVGHDMTVYTDTHTITIYVYTHRQQYSICSVFVTNVHLDLISDIM